MSFTISDFREWARILREHPEWRDEARRLILSDELLELPLQVREVKERVDLVYDAQQRLEGRVDRLETALIELAEAQKRAEERLAGVEERLTRLETAVAELAEAQKRAEERLAGVEERLTRLETAVAELAEAQKRTEQRVEELAIAQAKLGAALGELQHAFGSTVEEEAASVVEVILRRKGYRILQEAFSIALDGEIDVVVPAEDAQGKRIWALVEAKARLSKRDVRSWSQRIREEQWHQRLKVMGILGPFLVYAYCIRADLGAYEQVEKEGIGLLKSDGEVLAPRELIEPSQ